MLGKWDAKNNPRDYGIARNFGRDYGLEPYWGSDLRSAEVTRAERET